MNRKLHNTLMAIIASSSLLTLGLIAGAPVMPTLHAGVDPTAIATIEEVTALPDAAIDDVEPAANTPRSSVRTVRGNRQSVSMPFFSFVPRG
ncbi:MAG: hypothetical protein V4704_05800 [Pseudomonadota bacterium]